ncbi:hypothetical protein Mycch_4620 [Mycolicibacterium chubuense NBB4]|uniref:Uncharacterized protein n=1 Tax=Mycolicibacterium chubuense (strain NBB4) TaxID=710421 RepID=I4BPW5_MYCCN|nr:hypothetical protein [Mycolicibacterium chubuense]AFM19322.1 hypothetical protein Mycch_4620 [Mycolicibacterium chubuense NBB4]
MISTVAAVQGARNATRSEAGDFTGQPTGAVWDLLIFQVVALTLQLVAVTMAWRGVNEQANILSCGGIAMTFASALWALSRPRLDRALRNTAVVCLGITTTVQWRMNDPLLFRGYDEQLHMRTLADIESSHSLFQPHPLLAVSPRYPGLEALAAFFTQLGLPVMIAATAVVLLARLALVLTLCAAVEHLTGSPRAGGLAVAVYAISPQFVFFNSQFAYQTLSLPLALAAVAFIAQARRSDDARPLLAGATTCLLAVAFTHHLTSLLTAAFLIVWAMAEPKGQVRRRVAFGAVVAVLATAFWAAVQWSLLRDYFGPMIDDVVLQLTSGMQRSPFSETSADPKPSWERGLLLYYALIVSLTVSFLVLLSSRSLVRRVRFASGRRRVATSTDDLRPWEPRIVLVMMVAMIPLLFAARALPRWGEVGDRASTFLYLPFSLLVVGVALYWFRKPLFARKDGSDARHGRRCGATRARGRILIRPLALILGTAAFLGGYLLGSGSEWARLPGGYLPGGDGRSMDAETLAAVRWARDQLPAGSRIGADRLSATLLASRARLWPVLTHTDSPEVASLYKADGWGPGQSDIVRSKHLQYLYVDRRFAGAEPRVGTYFDESPALKLTYAELTKFDRVPEIRQVYRHGPISIYDLSGLGVSIQRSGWFGQTRPSSIPTQVLIGLLYGTAFALIGRGAAGKRVTAAARSILTVAGPFLSFTFGLAVLCVSSVMLLLFRIWLGPAIFISLVLAIALVNPRCILRAVTSIATVIRWKWFVATVTLALAAAAVITLSALHASAAHRLAFEEDTILSATAAPAVEREIGCVLPYPTLRKGDVG